MVFEEQFLCKLLNGMDCSEEKITEASNYMIKYIDNYRIIVDIWLNFYKSTKSGDTKLGLFYLMHEVMFQSYILKKDKYIIRFGSIMEEVILIMIKSFGDELEFINKLLKIIEFWEKKMYFSKQYIDKLKNPVIIQKKKIYENEPKLQLNESIKNEEIKKLLKNNLTKQGLILSIEQNNIKSLNEKINYDKINDLLVDRDINDYKRRDIKKYETKLKALREIYINDIVKREKYMFDLVYHIHNEKEIFFDIVNGNNNNKEPDKNDNIDNDISNNNQ
jgi:hypothetical protein